MLKALN